MPCAAVLDTAAEQNQIQVKKLKVQLQPCPESSIENAHLSFLEVQGGHGGEQHDGLLFGCPVKLDRFVKHLPCAQIYKQTWQCHSELSILTTCRRTAVQTGQRVQQNLLSTAATLRGCNCGFDDFPLIVASRAFRQILHIFASVLSINKAVLGSLSNKRNVTGQ